MAGSSAEGVPLMRRYYVVRLNDRTITKRELTGEAIVKAGRYLIAKTLLELDVATVDPLSPLNPLIFSAGPFAGTSWSNANRTSVGCKSPLTGGVKEANGGGTFSYGLGQLKIAGLTLHGASPSWVVLHIKKGGDIDFDDAAPYLGRGNFEAQALLHARYGKKVTIALCGPVGEYQGLIAGIAFSDKDGRPARLSARGGVGAVMGSKKVKAIVVDLDKIPPFEDAKKVNAAIKDYAKMLLADSLVTNFYAKIGTMGMADLQNTLVGLWALGAGAFGEVRCRTDCVAESRRATEKGRLWAQGTARVGEHYKVRRVPVIKKQAISAYDPRVVEATGISMMATAQGADHTAGNLPRLKTREMDIAQIVEQSLAHQARIAAKHSTGPRIFVISVAN